jgi:hypothetical protein
MDSSYDPTIGAWWSGEDSEAFERPRGRIKGVCGVEFEMEWESWEREVIDRRG